MIMYAWVYVCENASTNRPDIERCFMQIVVTKKATYRISIEHTAHKSGTRHDPIIWHDRF